MKSILRVLTLWPVRYHAEHTHTSTAATIQSHVIRTVNERVVEIFGGYYLGAEMPMLTMIVATTKI